MEINKFAGAVLGTLGLAMLLTVVSDEIFAHAKLASPAYAVAVASETRGAEAPAVAPIAERLAKADAKKGEAGTKACQACHSFDKAAANKAGPALYGVVGRPKGSVAGFAYSDSIKTKGGVWTADDLDHFLAGPKAYASGTKMTYSGEADAAKRADIIAYLRTLPTESRLSQTK